MAECVCPGWSSDVCTRTVPPPIHWSRQSEVAKHETFTRKGTLGIKGTQRVRESLVLSSGYVVLIVVAVLSNYPALSRAVIANTGVGALVSHGGCVLSIGDCLPWPGAPHLLRIF